MSPREQKRLYYTTPPENEFCEVKKNCIDLWNTMGVEPGYSQGKIKHVETTCNIRDNMMYLIAMFSENNQKTLIESLSENCRISVLKRIYDGGPDNYVLRYFPMTDILKSDGS